MGLPKPTIPLGGVKVKRDMDAISSPRKSSSHAVAPPAKGQAKPPAATKAAVTPKTAKKTLGPIAKNSSKSNSSAGKSGSSKANKGAPAKKGKGKSQADKEAAAEKLRLHRRIHSTIARVRDYRPGWAYKLVFEGKKSRTYGKLFKKDLMRNKVGRIVSKRRHILGKRMFKENGLDKWLEFAMRTKQELGLKGFVKMKKAESGSDPDASRLYRKTLEKWIDKTVAKMNERLQGSGSTVRLKVVAPGSPPVPGSSSSSFGLVTTQALRGGR